MKRRSPLWARPFQYLYTFKLTPAGRVVTLLILMSAAGLVTVEIPVYQIFCAMFCLFATTSIVGSVCRPRLEVSGGLPDKVTAGDISQGQLLVKNVGRWPAWDIMCRLPRLPEALKHVDAHAVIHALPPGEQVELPVSIAAFQRGDFPLPDAQVHSTFPLNLIRFGSVRVPTRRLTVLPAFHRLQQFDVPLIQRFQAGGLLLHSRTGQASEYSGNREYVPGEPVKRLDFRAWARLGRPVVREYQGEFSSRVAIVLDTHVARRWGRGRESALAAFEAAISLTAAITDSLEGIQTSLDLFAAGPDLFLFQSPEGGTHLDAVMDILAAVESTNHNPFEDLAPAIEETVESTSLVICILLDWDESRKRFLESVFEQGGTARVFIVRDGPCTLAPPDEEGHLVVTPEAVRTGALPTL